MTSAKNLRLRYDVVPIINIILLSLPVIDSVDMSAAADVTLDGEVDMVQHNT